MSDKLVQLYQKMSELTAPECAGIGPSSCKCPHSCCDELACSITKDFALNQGVTLPEFPPNYKGAFYLNETGCTVAPHLRPLCTVHTCQISSLGFKPGDPEWTKKYFKLRNQIDKLEHQESRW
jgi:hypothetical protein